MKIKMISSLVLVVGGLGLLALTLSSSTKHQPKFDNSTVTSLDLDNYLGEWYEIVRKPHSFEKGMSHVKTTYTLLPDGKIEVRNEGMKNGKHKVARGKARTTDNPGQLKVTFFIFPAQYNILELAPDYSYSVVGSSSPKYLWILSRTPQLTSATKGKILKNLQQRGYDTNKLIWVEQK